MQKEVNKDMKKTLMINEKCIQCGSCLGLEHDFLESLDDGSILVKPGTFLNDDMVEKLKEICPADAFEFGEKISKKRILLDLRQELANVKGCLAPVAKDFPFDKSEYKISLPTSSGRSGYEYSSDDAAERAALSEFKSKMYSQIDNLILKIITEYRIKYVRPYYTKEVDAGSVYAKINSEVNGIIEGIINVLEKDSPTILSKIEVFPDSDMTWKMLNKGELLSDEMISAVKKEFDYDADTYSCKWTTDYIERPAGKDIFGNYKTKEKYCYKNVTVAYEELAKDLLNCFEWAKDELEKRAVEVSSWLVEIYNKMLREEINKRVKILDDILSNMTEDCDSNEGVSLEVYESIERRVSYNTEKQCIIVNGQEVKESECFIAGDNELQIFFDGNSLYKRYVDKKHNMVMNEILFPENRYDKSFLVGKGNIVLLWDNNNAIYTYHIKEGEKYSIAKEAYNTVCIAGEKICYSKWDYHDRFGAKKLYVCDFKGKNIRTIDSVPYSRDILLFRNAREEDNKLKYQIANVMQSDRSIEKEIDIDRLEGSGLIRRKR